MNQKLALQIKESVLDILSWTNNPNRKLSLECINEIGEQILQDLTYYLKEEAKSVEDQLQETEFPPLSRMTNSVNWCVKCDHHLSKCECDLDCEDASRSDDCSHCCETLETKE